MASIEVPEGRPLLDLLHEFCFRIESIHQRSHHLQGELHGANLSVNYYQHTLSECERALAVCRDKIDEERLEHRGTIEALNFERDRRQEAERLFDFAFETAKQISGLNKDLTKEFKDARGKEVYIS